MLNLLPLSVLRSVLGPLAAVRQGAQNVRICLYSIHKRLHIAPGVWIIEQKLASALKWNQEPLFQSAVARAPDIRGELVAEN